LTASRTVLVSIYSRLPAWNIPLANVTALREQFPRHAILHARTHEEALRAIDAADIVFTAFLRRNLFEAAERLTWIHSPAAGLEGILSAEIIDSPIVVTNSRGLSADTIAEHVLAVVLALFRKLPLTIEAQRTREWAQTSLVSAPPLRTIAGSRVLIVGLGAIGVAAAQRFASLSAHVDAVRRRPELPHPPSIERVGSNEDLLDLLPSADVVVLAAPDTTATRHLIGARELAAMRPGSILVNVSRGTLVDEAALIRALTASTNRTLAAAALDVFEHEPLPPESPLWSLPNVLITPHIAGFRPDHWDAVCALFAENLHRFDTGQPLLNVVNKQEGY
jgi:phosphoglycerate dehydrogenase-like enzyme